MPSDIGRVLFTGKTHTIAARGGEGSKSGEHVDIHLSTPGHAGDDMDFASVLMHPTAEQLFAGAWSACFTGALGLAAQQRHIKLPPDLSVDVEVDLGLSGDAFLLQARFVVGMPGVADDVAEALVHAAHGICPYSKAVHGNIHVTTDVRTETAVA